MSYKNRKKEIVYSPDASKPTFPRREDFPSLVQYRHVMQEYDRWVNIYVSGKFMHISKNPLKFPAGIGTTYTNPSRANRLPRKVRKKNRAHRV